MSTTTANTHWAEQAEIFLGTFQVLDSATPLENVAQETLKSVYLSGQRKLPGNLRAVRSGRRLDGQGALGTQPRRRVRSAGRLFPGRRRGALAADLRLRGRGASEGQHRGVEGDDGEFAEVFDVTRLASSYRMTLPAVLIGYRGKYLDTSAARFAAVCASITPS